MSHAEPRTKNHPKAPIAPYALAADPSQTGFSDRRRVDWVDYAKGICILLVVMMHSTLGVEKAAGQTGWLGLVVEFSRPFRMPDFFLISGLFLGLVISRDWLRYLDRKVVHFLYFYGLWVTIQFAFKALGWMAEGLPTEMLIGKYFFSFIQPFGTLWFIYMLPVFFVLTRLLRRIPWQFVLGGAALLEMLPIHTGWMMIDEFAARYVYFLAGCMLATKIFEVAEWVRANKAVSTGLLFVWALINGVIVFAPTGGVLGLESFANLPIVSLALGAAGALAIICGSVLISTLSWTGFLEYLGRNSIVIYLAFFLPMAVSRVILLKFAPFLDIGTVSALVMIAAASGPVVLYWMIQWSGYGNFLFHRPHWAWIDRNRANAKAQLHPAE